MATRTQLLMTSLIFCLIFSSCKVYQKVDWIEPKMPVESRNKYFEPRQLSKISEGDYLDVLTIDSISYEITFSMVRNDSIQGLFTQKNNRRIKFPIQSGIPISEIKMIKVKKFNYVATMLTVVSIPIGLWLMVKSITFSPGFFGI